MPMVPFDPSQDLETACSNWEMRYRELENEYNKKARDASSLEKEARELTDKLQSKDREIQVWKSRARRTSCRLQALPVGGNMRLAGETL